MGPVYLLSARGSRIGRYTERDKSWRSCPMWDDKFRDTLTNLFPPMVPRVNVVGKFWLAHFPYVSMIISQAHGPWSGRTQSVLVQPNVYSMANEGTTSASQTLLPPYLPFLRKEFMETRNVNLLPPTVLLFPPHPPNPVGNPIRDGPTSSSHTHPSQLVPKLYPLQSSAFHLPISLTYGQNCVRNNLKYISAKTILDTLWHSISPLHGTTNVPPDGHTTKKNNNQVKQGTEGLSQGERGKKFHIHSTIKVEIVLRCSFEILAERST